MKTKILASLLGLATALVLSSCAITQHVRPAAQGTTIRKIYVHENPEIHMKGLVPEVVAQIRQLGFAADSYAGVIPAKAIHHMEITANWRWDMAMYLVYFRASLLEDDVVLGVAEYDARMGGANMGKFGATAEKIKPLLAKLLKDATREAPAGAVGVSAP